MRISDWSSDVCSADLDGARVALVVDQAGGSRFEAVRGGGAHVDGRPLAPTGCTELGDALVGLSGLPPWWFGWQQFRAYGAVALEDRQYAVVGKSVSVRLSRGCSRLIKKKKHKL